MAKQGDPLRDKLVRVKKGTIDVPTLQGRGSEDLAPGDHLHDQYSPVSHHHRTKPLQYDLEFHRTWFRDETGNIINAVPAPADFTSFQWQWEVPDNVTQITISAVGGGGGGGSGVNMIPYGEPDDDGGGGGGAAGTAQIDYKMNVSTGDILLIEIGHGGKGAPYVAENQDGEEGESGGQTVITNLTSDPGNPLILNGGDSGKGGGWSVSTYSGNFLGGGQSRGGSGVGGAASGGDGGRYIDGIEYLSEDGGDSTNFQGGNGGTDDTFGNSESHPLYGGGGGGASPFGAGGDGGNAGTWYEYGHGNNVSAANESRLNPSNPHYITNVKGQNAKGPGAGGGGSGAYHYYAEDFEAGTSLWNHDVYEYFLITTDTTIRDQFKYQTFLSIGNYRYKTVFNTFDIDFDLKDGGGITTHSFFWDEDYNKDGVAYPMADINYQSADLAWRYYDQTNWSAGGSFWRNYNWDTNPGLIVRTKKPKGLSFVYGEFDQKTLKGNFELWVLGGVYTGTAYYPFNSSLKPTAGNGGDGVLFLHYEVDIV